MNHSEIEPKGLRIQKKSSFGVLHDLEMKVKELTPEIDHAKHCIIVAMSEIDDDSTYAKFHLYEALATLKNLHI